MFCFVSFVVCAMEVGLMRQGLFKVRICSDNSVRCLCKEGHRRRGFRRCQTHVLCDIDDKVLLLQVCFVLWDVLFEHKQEDPSFCDTSLWVHGRRPGKFPTSERLLAGTIQCLGTLVSTSAAVCMHAQCVFGVT